MDDEDTNRLANKIVVWPASIDGFKRPFSFLVCIKLSQEVECKQVILWPKQKWQQLKNYSTNEDKLEHVDTKTKSNSLFLLIVSCWNTVVLKEPLDLKKPRLTDSRQYW
jgi:hypothetical protein